MKQNIYIPGDLVKYDNDLGKVTEIGTSDWYDGAYTCKLRFFSSHNYFVVGQCDIEPIPLTPEILEKNGWKKRRNTYGFRRYCFKRPSYPTLNIVTENEVEFHWGGYDLTIHYVHELQHLLFGLGLNTDMEV